MLNHDEGTIGRMLSRAISKIAQDNSPPNADLRRNVSACKTDILSASSGGGEEARRLFANTTAYDSDIIAVKRALENGSPIINVVCRGYANEPQHELANLIINTALVDAPTLAPGTAEYDEDRRQRMDRFQRSVVGRRFFHYPLDNDDAVKIQGSLERQLLGETRWNPDSSRNAVIAYLTRDPQNPTALPAGEIPMGTAQDGLLPSLMLERTDDIICDPDVPDSYLYPYLSETGTTIGSMEVQAKEKRQKLRAQLRTQPNQAVQGLQESDRLRLIGAADQMNRFYHALFNIQGISTGEGWRFIPYMMGDGNIYGGGKVHDWSSTEKINGASDFVNISRGIPSLDEIEDFDDILFDAENQSDDPEGESVEAPPVSSGNYDRDTMSQCVRWILSVAPDIVDDRIEGMPTAEQIVSAVNSSADSSHVLMLANRMSDINMVSALASLVSSEVESFIATAPQRRAVNRYFETLQTELQEMAGDLKGNESSGTERSVSPEESRNLDIPLDRILPALDELSEYVDQNNVELRQSDIVPQYAVDNVTHRRIENPSRQQIKAEADSRAELVRWWTSPGNAPQYVIDNLDRPELVYAWMLSSAPVFSALRSAMLLAGEPYTDSEALRGVIRGLRRATAGSSVGMKKLSAFDPERMRGYDDIRNRLVGTQGKKTSEITRGRSRAWALSSGIRQILDAFQGVALEPFSEATASGRLGRGRTTSVGANSVVVDVSELISVIPGIDSGAGITWAQIITLLEGKSVTLVSDDGGIGETNKISTFGVPRGVLNTNDPIEISSGLTCTITLANEIRGEMGSSFRVSLPIGDQNSVPSDTELLSFEYGLENVDRIKSLQQRYGASINRGPLPNWAPNPYCFIWNTGETTPNPNNIYNVVDALRKRERVLDHHRNKAGEGGVERKLHAFAVQKLTEEVEQMRACVTWAERSLKDEIIWSRESERESGAEPMVEARYTAYSPIRYISNEQNGQPTSDSFYEITRNRCSAEGIKIPIYDSAVDDEAISRLLNRDQFRRFLQIKGDVLEDFKSNGRSILFLDSLDNRVSKNHNNGIVEMVEGAPAPGGREGDAVLQQGRSSNVLKLIPRVSDMFNSFTGAVKSNARSHVVAVTTQPIVGEEGDPPIDHIMLSVDIASPQVVSEYVRIVESKLKKTLGGGKSATDKAVGFSLPESFVAKMKKGLSGLLVSDVKAQIEKMVEELFQQYEKIGDIGTVLVNSEEDIRQKLSVMQKHNAVRERLNIERKTPKVGYREYVTEVGTDWAKFIQGEFARLTETIKTSQRTIDLLSRCQDFNVFFGAMKHEKTENGVVLRPSYAESGDLVWFSPNGDVGAVGNVSLDAAAGRFGVSPISMRDYLASIGIKAVESGQMEGVSVDPEAFNTFLGSFQGKLVKLETQIEAAKKQVKPINVLYGGPGTGKTIFGDVLAKAFDLHYDFCTFTTMFHSGGTSLRGQAEANVRDFLNYCRNARDTVMVIDEFDTFFRGGTAGGDAGDVERLRGELQVAWENDQPVYKAHNFYIVCTTNMTLQEMESNHRFQALKNRMGRHEVVLPKSINSMLEFFARGAAVNNLMNLSCGDDRLIEWGKQLVEIWDVPGEEKQKQSLLESIQRVNPKFFESTGILRPALNRAEYLKTIGIDHNEPIDSAEDWVRGWKEAQELFNRMARATTKHQTDRGKITVSWLDRIAKLMHDKMTYLPDPNVASPESESISRLSLRELMTKIEKWIYRHGEWSKGEPGSLPLTYHTLWYGLAGTTFTERALKDEEKNLPQYRYLQEEGLLNSEDGFENLICATTTPGTGLTVDDFLDEASVRYQTEARFIGASFDPMAQLCIDHRIPQMAEKQFDIAKRALRLSGAGSGTFGAKAPEIVASLKRYGREDYDNAATMIERFVSGREAVAENIVRYNAVKDAILSRPGGQQEATDQERKMIGELLVPLTELAWNGRATGLEQLLKTSSFAAASNLPHMKLEVVKNWFDLVVDGYLRISSSSSGCSKIAGEMVGKKVRNKTIEDVIQKRYAAIEAGREEHMANSSIKLADLAPGDLTPDEVEAFRDVLGMDFQIPDYDLNDIEREINDNIVNEGRTDELEEVEDEEAPEEPAPVMEAPIDEVPGDVEPADSGQTVENPPLSGPSSPTITLPPGFTGAPAAEREEEPVGTVEPVVQEEEPEPEPEPVKTRKMPGSISDIIEKNKRNRDRKGSSSKRMIKMAQAIGRETAEKVAGWNNLRLIKLLADRDPNVVEVGPYSYIDSSEGLQGTLKRPTK